MTKAAAALRYPDDREAIVANLMIGIKGTVLAIDRATDHIFGLVLMNDWSARDVQTWEYQPLGPFLAKNFCTSISPWVVTLEALEPFRKPLPSQDPAPLPYLRAEKDFTYDIQLEAHLQTACMEAPHVITRTNFQNLYWSIAQQLAHHTVNGCNLQPGDLLASGTLIELFPRWHGERFPL